MSRELLTTANDSKYTMSAKKFFEIADSNMLATKGNGFRNKGMTISTESRFIGDGLWVFEGDSNNLNIGRRKTDVSSIGDSDTGEAVVEMNGVQIHVLNSTGINTMSMILPDAPDGLDKKSGLGRFGSLAEAVTSGGNYLTNSVLSRKDFVFIEVWHEEISRTGVFYPAGCVQFQSNLWEGISLTLGVVNQRYSAFHYNDWSTGGYGISDINLKGNDRKKFLEDPRNNIYFEGGKLIQVRWRIRSIAGPGDKWNNVDPMIPNYLRYNDNNNEQMVKPRGARIGFTYDLGSFSNAEDGYGYYSWNNRVNDVNSVNYTERKGAWQSTGASKNFGYKDLCYAIPIALVQRRNKGFHHPSHNPHGCAVYKDANGGFINPITWDQVYLPIVNKRLCFVSAVTGVSAGYAGGMMLSGTNWVGRVDNKFFDSILASDVEDHRMFTVPVNHEIVRKDELDLMVRGKIHKFGTAGYVWASQLSGNTVTSYLTFINKPAWWDVIGAPLGGAMSIPNGKMRVIIHASDAVYSVGTVGQADGTFGGHYYVRLYAMTDLDHIQNIHTHGLSAANWIAIDFSDYDNHGCTDPTQADIISSPTNIAQTFPDGIYGNYNAVMPNNVNTHFKARKRTETIINHIFTTNDGGSWTDGGGPYADASATGNILYDSNTLNSNILILYYYKTNPEVTRPVDNSNIVLNMGDVTYTSSERTDRGNALAYSLTGKVNLNSGNGGIERHALTSIGISKVSGRLVSNATYGFITHPILHSASSGYDYAVKFIDYVSDENGRLVMNLMYQEIVMDSTADHDTAHNNVTGSSISTKTAGQIYNITSGTWQGTWLCKITNSIAFDAFAATLFDDKLMSSSGGVYYTKWDNTGWGDDATFKAPVSATNYIDENGKNYIVGNHEMKLPYFT